MFGDHLHEYNVLRIFYSEPFNYDSEFQIISCMTRIATILFFRYLPDIVIADKII